MCFLESKQKRNIHGAQSLCGDRYAQNKDVTEPTELQLRDPWHWEDLQLTRATGNSFRGRNYERKTNMTWWVVSRCLAFETAEDSERSGCTLLANTHSRKSEKKSGSVFCVGC